MAEQVGGIYYDVTLDTRKLVDGTRVVDRELSAVAGKFSIVAAAVAALGAAMAAARIAQRADEFRLLASRVEVAAGSVQSGVVAFESLVAISRRTQSSLAGNIEVFNRLNQSLLQMGGTQNDTLLVTELLAKAIKVSGASAVEAKAAMLQFGQALGSGKLAGDELRSLMETAPYLMRQLADGIGVPVGALKKLGEEGKLTADVVVNALTKAAARIDEDFKKFPQTIEAAMVVAADAAGLAAKQLDELTGTSATLTGVVKGTGEVVEKLAEQFAEANRQAGTINRNDFVRSWADATRNALSYLADAVDASKQVFDSYFVFLQYGFRSVGNWIGAATAQAAALARGDVAGALAINADLIEQQKKLAAQFDANKAAVTARSGKMLSGEKMRAGWAMGDLGQSDPTELARRGRGPGAGRLKSGGDSDGGRTKTSKFDAGAYLAGLEKATLDGIERVDAMEREALRKNAELLKQKKISAEQAAKAVTLIETNAAQERRDIQLRNAEDIRSAIEQGGKEEAAAQARLEAQRQQGQSLAAGAIAGAQDPVTRLQIELQQKSKMLADAAALDMENLQLYAAARVALEDETARQIAEIRQRQVDQQAQNNAMSLALMSDLAGQAYSVLEKSGREQTALGKALFIAQKAIAVAEIILNTEVAAAKAGAQLGIFGLPLATMIRATGYASAGLVAGLAIGEAVSGKRQYGGPVSAGSLYRVNETGQPEMFTASNGSQYMMPTASGKVTAADKVGASRAPTVIIQNMGNPVAVQSQSWDQQTNTMRVTLAEAARQIREREGPMWAALGTTNVRGQV